LEEPGNLEIAYKGSNATPKNAMHAKRLNRVHRIPLGEPLPADAELFYQPGPLCRVRRHQRSRPKFSRNGEPRFRRGPLHSNAEARAEKEQALELKLILSSDTHGWNISENFIAEKPLNYSDPWEFWLRLGGRPAADAQCHK